METTVGRQTVAEVEFMSGLPRRVVVQARKLKDERRRLRHLCEVIRPHLSMFSRPVVLLVVDLIDHYLAGESSDAHLRRAQALMTAFDWSQESLPATPLGRDLMAAARAIGLPSSEAVDFRFPLLHDLDRQATLLRDIHGNPFRPIAFSPAWRTAATLGLAQGMYESRDFAGMPVLADALEEAGCESADVLAHCRGPGPHVRGCWVVDLVLGKS
jgi:hypothetical protein